MRLNRLTRARMYGVRSWCSLGAEARASLGHRGVDVGRAWRDAGARQLGRLEGSVADLACDMLVRVAERDSLGDHRLRGVRRRHERIAARSRQPLVVEFHAADEHLERSERAANVTPRSEDRLLVLLQVAVVREWEPLDRCEQAF